MTLEEFRQYLIEFSEAGSRPSKEHRYFSPKFTRTAPVSLSNRTAKDVARSLLNYIQRYDLYIQTSRNCQTFACDFYVYLTGQTDVVPYQPFLVPFYKSRVLNFLYDTGRYRRGKEKTDKVIQSNAADVTLVC